MILKDKIMWQHPADSSTVLCRIFDVDPAGSEVEMENIIGALYKKTCGTMKICLTFPTQYFNTK